MPKIELGDQTVERMDALLEDDQTYDELVNELINILQAEEMTLFHGGDYE